MAAVLYPLGVAVGAAASVLLYKKAKNASSTFVPERYTKISQVFPEEYDDMERETDIYLLFVPLENMDILASFTSLQHWAIGCDYGNRAAIYELTGDPIKPCWTQWNMGDRNDANFSHVIKLGSVKCSPKRLRQLALDNVYNGTHYRAIANNCQDWVEWFLYELEPDLARALFAKGVRKIGDTFIGAQVKSNKSLSDRLPFSLSGSAGKLRSNAVPRNRAPMQHFSRIHED